jgi:hypothetical protein
VLLLLTTAGDGTSDRLAQRLGNHIFRLNFDQLPEYKISFGLNNWYVENPVGRSISSEGATKVLWWKAFGATPDGYDKYLIEESKYLEIRIKLQEVTFLLDALQKAQLKQE